MYFCESCGISFEVREKMTEPHGELVFLCPRCHDHKIVEAKNCKICGEYISPEFTICEDCLFDIDKLIAFGEEKNDVNSFFLSVIGADIINEITKVFLAEEIAKGKTLRAKFISNIEKYINENRGDLDYFFLESVKNGL